MAFPTTVLDAQFLISFDGATQVDVSDYVHDGATRRFNRSSASNSMDAGTVTFTLDAPRGTPGLFNPWDPSGAYWQERGWRGAPVQILLESGSWFYGRISRTSPYWDQDGDGHCTIEAAGPLRWLTLNAPSRSPIERAILAADPDHYWQVNEGADATLVASGLPQGQALSQSQLSFDTIDGPAGAPGSYAEFLSGGAYFGYVAFGLNRDTSSTPIVIEFWFRATASVASGQECRIFGWSASGAYFEWTVRGFTAGGTPYLTLQAEALGTTWNPCTIGVDWSDGNWHQVVCSITESGGNVTATMYADGAGPSSDTVATTATRILNIEGPWTHSVIVNSLVDMTSLSIGHIAIYSAVPADHSGAGTAWAGEEASTRFLRLCAEEGYSGILTYAETTALMGPQPVDKVLNLMRQCEATDQGRIVEIPLSAKTLGFTPRRARYNAAVTLALDASDLASSPRPDGTIGGLVGEVVLSRSAGTSVVAKDQDVLDAGGTSISPQDIDVAADEQLEPLAGFVLGVNSSTDAKVSTISIDFSSAAGAAHLSTWKTAVAAGVDNVRATVAGWDGYPDGLDCFIEGGTERISQTDWRLDAVISPADPYRMFVRGSTTYGRRDGAHSYLASALDADDLTFMVTTATGSAWTTVDAQQPSPIRLGGEKITLSDVAGTGATAFGAAGAESHANNGSVTPGLPAGLALSDAMYLVAAIRNSGTGTPDTPAGWTLLADASNLRLFGKIAAAGESGPTVTFTGGAANATCSAQIFSVPGGSLGIAAGPTVQLNTTAQDVATPGLSIADGGGPVLVLWFGWKQDDATAIAGPAAGTKAMGNWSTLGDDQSTMGAYLITMDPATIAASSFAITGGATAISRGGIIALRANAQLFTASARSVNSVVKSHAARAGVRVWKPGRRGL